MVKTIPVVILAGGEGRRIGGDKPRRRLVDKTLLAHAIDKAGTYSSTIAISVGSGTHPQIGGISVIQDEGEGQGPIAGLMAAFKFASVHGFDHVMIIPCDTPFLPGDLLRRLHDGLGDAKAAVAQCGGHLHSACSLWRVGAGDLLSGYLGQGRRSLTGFAEMAGYVIVEWPVQDAGRFTNINTADDLLRAERIIARLI